MVPSAGDPLLLIISCSLRAIALGDGDPEAQGWSDTKERIGARTGERMSACSKCGNCSWGTQDQKAAVRLMNGVSKHSMQMNSGRVVVSSRNG